jgi:hypothetical protein
LKFGFKKIEGKVLPHKGERLIMGAIIQNLCIHKLKRFMFYRQGKVVELGSRKASFTTALK